MRVTSSLFVSALIRRIFSAGGFCAVERHGFDEAGAIFIIHRDRLGQNCLYGPAEQTAYDADEASGGRRFRRLLENVEGEEVSARMEREACFDSDLWLVEVEWEREPFEAMIELAD